MKMNETKVSDAETRTFLFNWPYAYGEPLISGLIRSTPEDFQVDEVLGFEADGDGTHAFLKVRKKNANTEWVAKQIARFAGVRQVDVGYAGLKDRRAVTTQWFSVDLAGKEEPDWHSLTEGGIEFVEITRHRRKLKRGALQGNRFKLVVRDIEGDLDLLKDRISKISLSGVPNYFGEQRFGFSNLEKASAMFAGKLKKVRRPEKGMYLSAARSWIFNRILAARVESGAWNQAMAGDVMMLAGSQSIFPIAAPDDEIAQRINELDVHPTGAMWGSGELVSTMEVAALEQSVAKDEALFCDGLTRAGLKQQRRSLRLIPEDLQCTRLEPQVVELQFELPAGSYATVVLRELFRVAA
ncbi:tRNA pseudouridine(13) synthase [hydrothermal vent metagenome]|uniref:tRNA pseudouridine(13) synthase n=1 Tax=hydrothermal vent metagenome TaxID=652676 RepID=A0A3B0ZWR2_9ZZZZ